MSVSMLSEQLLTAGVATEVYTTTASGKDELPVLPGEPLLVDGVRVTYFMRLTKDHSHLSPALLNQLWNEAGEFDIIHIHAWWNLVSILSCLLALMRGVPVVVSPRGTLSPYTFKNKNICSKWLVHHLLGKTLLNRSHIHVTSNREEASVAEIIKPRSFINIPNFVKLPGQTMANRKTSDIFRLIFFSRIEEKKGLEILLNALPLLTISYSLTIAGGGDEDYINNLKAIITKNGSAPDVNWIGFQDEGKFQLLYEHDLLILPSYDENFGNVIIESLGVGTAVLVSPFVGLSGYVTGNKLGWETDASATAIADKISFIQGQREALKFIRLNAPGKIRNDFSDDFLTRQYTAMYEKVVDN